jgi:flagellum-specific peptidoglycan hydrolase FlgJ
MRKIYIGDKEVWDISPVVKEETPTPVLPEIEKVESRKIPIWAIALIGCVFFVYNQGKLEWQYKGDGRTDTIYQIADTRPPERVAFRARNKEQQLQVDFIERWLPVAKVESVKYGIPVSIKLAQGIVESKSGTSDVCEKYNNWFGVLRDGQYRMYLTAWASWRHHSEVLSLPLYKELHGKDYKGWAHGLQRLGYATDTHYADTLIHVIEHWGLQRYDSQTLSPQTLSPQTP